MELSLFLAKLIGITFSSLAVMMLFCKEQFKKSIKVVISSPTLMLADFINIVIGLAIAIGHRIWEWSWRVIITILGYHIIS